MKIKKFIAYGHPLHSHSHSYIHDGFLKAAKFLGYECYWVTGPDNNVDFNDAIILTEGQVCQNMPRKSSSFYILHNCSGDFTDIRHIVLQFIHNNAPFEVINKYTRWNNITKTLYQPWATDFLPHEFIEATPAIGDTVYWIGSIWNNGQGQGNTFEISDLQKWTLLNNLKFIGLSKVENPEKLIRASAICPAIVGQWQKDHAYLPCRFLKNISYGRFCATNSSLLASYFDSPIYSNEDIATLCDFSINKKVNRDLFLEVKNKHTYINRIKTILKIFDLEEI